MSKIFWDLATNNQIEIGAIPHILRSEPKIIKLFKLYSMDNLLPQFKPNYDPTQFNHFEICKSSLLEHKRQFLNYCAFSNYGFEYDLRGLKIHLLQSNVLDDLMSGVYISDSLVNFIDGMGNFLHPFIYTDFATNFTDSSSNIIFLAKYSMQNYNVFLRNGTLIDENDYGAWHYKGGLSYTVLIRYWAGEGYKCSYDIETNQLIRQKVFIDTELGLTEINDDIQ